jgi:hypothetical protein
MNRVLQPTAARRVLSDRLARIGAVAALTLVVGGVVGQLVDYGVYDLRLRALDSARDGALAAVVTGAGLLAACAAAGALALADRAARRSELALAGALAFLALDRLLGLHHHIREWRLVYLPVLAATLLALAVVGRGLGRGAVTVLIGAVCLLSFSLVLHGLGDWIMARLGEPADSWAFQLKVGLKHGTEAAGWVLVALALGDAARRRQRGARRRRAPAGRTGVPTRG